MQILIFSILTIVNAWTKVILPIMYFALYSCSQEFYEEQLFLTELFAFPVLLVYFLY